MLGGATTGGATTGWFSAATIIAGVTAAVPLIATALLVGSVCVAGAVIIDELDRPLPLKEKPAPCKPMMRGEKFPQGFLAM